MDKQTTLAFVLIGAILIIWLYISSPTPPPPQKKLQDTTRVDTFQQNPQAIQDSILNETTKATEVSADSFKYGKYFSASSGEEKIITIENDLVLLQLSSRGGNIKNYYLKKFNNWYSAKRKEDKDIFDTRVQLINNEKSDAYDIAFVSSDGKSINTGGLDFTSDAKQPAYKLKDKDSLTITYTLKAAEGKFIQKVYTLYGSGYHIKSEIVLNGMNGLISNNTYDILWTNGINFVEHNSVDEATYSDASVYYGDEQVLVDAPHTGEKVEKDFNGRVDWIAVRNKYFTAIISPDDPTGVEGAYVEGRGKTFANQGVNETYNLRLTVPFKNTSVVKNSFLIYIGPVDYDILKTFGRNLVAIVDFGSFFGLKFIVRPIAEYILLPLFNFLHLFIPNYGFVIIVFSLIIKLVLYPLTKQSFQSMKKMQLLQPKMAEIKEKFKDDPAKMNKETMKLYSTYGVNPAGGCLPIILQMPIFIALWGLLKVAIDLRQQPFMGWIHDLSNPDVIFTLPFKIPIFGVDQVSGLALLMGITTFVQQKMSVKDPKQQALVYVMPVMLTIMFMSFPSGLNLYYFMFNVFSIGQQYYINHKHDGMVLEPVKNPKKSGGFMQRLMESAEQKSKVQQQRKKR